MKKIRKFFIALILSTVVYSVGAQDEQNNLNSQGDQNERSALHNLVERNTYGDNWLISLGGNANLLTAEQDGYIPLTKRIQYGGAFTVGKWFNQNFGARLQVMGGQLRGFNDAHYYAGNGAYYVWDNFHHSPPQNVLPNGDGVPMGGDPLDPNNASKYKFFTNKNGVYGFFQDFNYATATVDLMANLTNLFRGRYVDHNPVDFIPFVGVGYIHAFTNKVTTPNYNFLVFKIGIRVDFNLTDKLSIYIEPQYNITGTEFDGYVGTAPFDGIANVGLGVQYTFNKGFTTLSQITQLTADEFDRLNKKINDNRYLIENHQDILERQQDLLDRLKNGMESKKEVNSAQVVESSDSYLPDYVRFALDSYKIDAMEQYKIVQVAEYLKKNPDSKLLLVGYADRKTGNPRYNLKLSQNRVETVAAELSRLGVPSSRMICEWRGDKEQPFPMNNEWNRVVVMVERK